MPTNALATTTADLTAALGDIAAGVRKPWFDEKRIADAARASSAREIDALAARMRLRPFLIAQALGRPAMWPVEEREHPVPLTDLLHWCAESIADERDCARQGFYRRTFWHMQAIRAAETVLIEMIMEAE